MDHAALRTLILATPAAAELYAAGDDTGCAVLLNERTERGPVPLRELSAYTGPAGITGTVRALIEVPVGGEVAPGVPMTLPLKAALYTVETVLVTDYRLETADVDDPRFGAACDVLVSLGVMTADQRDDLLAMGAGRRSKAEATAGVGRAVTAADVGRARRLPA